MNYEVLTKNYYTWLQSQQRASVRPVLATLHTDYWSVSTQRQRSVLTTTTIIRKQLMSERLRNIDYTKKCLKRVSFTFQHRCCQLETETSVFGSKYRLVIKLMRFNV